MPIDTVGWIVTLVGLPLMIAFGLILRRMPELLAKVIFVVVAVLFFAGAFAYRGTL
jgi:hypothetical protein